MERRNYLQIPGPTNIPDRILRSLSKPLINHRGPEFEELVKYCIDGLKKIFKTNNDILLFPSSGSGILESTIVNLFSYEDTIITTDLGVFSNRMTSIGKNHKLNIVSIEKEWGDTVKPEDIKKILLNDKEHKIKGVCLPHNETSTGITNDIKEIAKVIKEINHPAILIVDAISSLASIELKTDEWEIDVVVSSSQKGLMLPPGLGIVALSDKAWKFYENSNINKWYFDYKAVKERMKTNQFPYTPPTTLLFGLKESIDMLLEEGIENVWKRHELMALAVKNAIKAMDLNLLAKDEDTSNTVTAIMLPDGIDFSKLNNILMKDYSVVIGGGLQKLKGKIFRIGHLGSIHHLEIYGVMGAVEMSLYRLGYNVKLGSAAKAVAETFLSQEVYY